MDFSFRTFDFGSLEAWDYRHVDLSITNKGAKKNCVLRVDSPKEVECLYVQDCALPDSSIIFRFLVNPSGKGRFDYSVQLLLADQVDPIQIRLVGEMKEAPVYEASALTACPDFKGGGGANIPLRTQTKLTVVTIDQLTRKVVPGTRVSMTKNGETIWSRNTNEEGKIREKGASGMYFFYAEHPDYDPEEKGSVVDAQRNYIIIELIRKADGHHEEVTENRDSVFFQDSFEGVDTASIETTTWKDSTPVFTSFQTDDFNEEWFRPVNLVFVLDVSGSMMSDGKLELMKTSLRRLAEILRPIDRMGLVVYADNAKVLLPSTSGINKEDILAQVDALKGGGYTAGGAGIELGYRVARQGFLADGHNEVIVITDGAFNKGTLAYKSRIAQEARDSLYFSVIGIKHAQADEQNLSDMAKIGKGMFLGVANKESALADLNWEIRKRAFRSEKK